MKKQPLRRVVNPTVLAIVLGSWGVYKGRYPGYKDRPWCIAHVPSKLRFVAGFKSRDAAKAAVEEIVGIAPELRAGGKAEIMKHRSQVAAVLKRAGVRSPV